jgi:uncharacterized protein (TIGR02246 family)
MKIFSLLFLLLSLTMIASAQNSKAQTDIRKVMDEQAAAWNRGDVEGFMQGYWKSEQMVFVSGNSVARGWQAALDRYKKNYDGKAKMGTLSFTDLEITVLSKDSAVVLGSWALKRESDNPGGKFTLIFRKFKDGWKIIHDHTS